MALELEHIQGNVLAGFNKDHQTFLFLRLPSTRDAAREWLGCVAHDVASHEQVAAFNALYKQVHRDPARRMRSRLTSVWMNLAFTHSGIARLHDHPDIGADPEAFRQGLAVRAKRLGHVGASDPATWLEPFRPNSAAIDAVMIVAGDDPQALDANVEMFATMVKDFGGAVVLRLRGDARPDLPGHEHFGFKDGVSQPGIRGVTPKSPTDPDSGTPGQDLLWPGEFVLGYPRQSRESTTAPGPIATADPPWAKNGSFLVFQRIAQDVAKFEASVASLSGTHNLPPELLAASFVGRHRSGCPLELLEGLGNLGQTQSDIGPSNPVVLHEDHINDFEFQDPDPVGYYVAHAAHVRKTYPRDQDPPGEALTQTRRILRRGIAFGAPYSSAASEGTPQHKDAERGLLFACYQSSIEAQFEFVQASMANPDFPAPGAGVDPLLNETPAATTIPQADPDVVPVEPFVRMTGGAYFFAPSIPALHMLSGAPA